MIRDGYILLIFPEGTRSETGVMADFKPSLGYLAMTNKCGILLMYLHNTHEAMPKGQVLARVASKRRVVRRAVLKLRRPGEARCREIAERRVSRDHASRRSHHSPTRAGRSGVDARRVGERTPMAQFIAERAEPSDFTKTKKKLAAKSSVLVTGATGFLGEHLCRALVDDGHIGRGLSRSRSAVLEELGVEHVRGDVLNADEVDRARDGVSAVFHSPPGAVSRDPGDAQRMMRLHVDGTRRVLEQMANAGVRRMILASTSGTIGVSTREEVLDESAPYAEQIVAGWPYYTSKIYQERLAFEHERAARYRDRRGQSVAAARTGDRRLSSTGDVRKFIKKQIPTIPDGGINFVDARDAAAAIAAALSKGRAGERYLLGGPNWTTKEFFGAARPRGERQPPRLEAAAEAQQVGAPA